MIPVRVHGVTADPTTNQFLMLLIDDMGNRLLPIVIGQWEAQSIAWNIQGITMQRPLTHDLFRSLLDSTDIKITRVVITNLNDNTFFATIGLNSSGIKVELDSRPSDAVAIALRVNAPIFVEEDVFNKAAVKVESEKEKENLEPEDFPESESANQLNDLQRRLDRAIELEDYETAAVLRDRIKKLTDDNDDDDVFGESGKS